MLKDGDVHMETGSSSYSIRWRTYAPEKFGSRFHFSTFVHH